jgi:methyl-accepting chemotaxis protein
MLADQSSESAAVISGIVEELIKNANVSVETMNQVLSALRTQEDKLADTRKVFGVLNEEISNVTAAVENISGQVDAIGKVKDGVQSSFDSLAAISQENAASTEETSAAMSELGRIVEECNTTVDEVVELSGKLVDEMKQFEL